MKWWPGKAKSGDMIRVQLGSIYHYGVYVSDEEVIQFGLPPVSLIRDFSKITVLSTDIETFSTGSIVEVALFDKKEQKSRIPSDKTVEIARSRIGEGGYNLIHNNCEHFASECVLGVKRCSQEEEAYARWANRPMLDIYLMKIPDDTVFFDAVSSPKRQKEIENCKNLQIKKEKYYAWKLLETAYKNSAKIDIDTVSFKKEINGKWTANKNYFSITHSDGIVAVAFSNAPCGIDIETMSFFNERRSVKLENLFNKITTSNEKNEPTKENFLIYWTQKESIFKFSNLRYFSPSKINVSEYPCDTLISNGEVYISISSDMLKNTRFFVKNEKITQISREEIEKDFEKWL